MVFNALAFFVFFAVVLVLSGRFLPWRVRKNNLLVISYLFYAAFEPAYVLILLTSTVVDWLVVKRMERTEEQRKRGLLLALSLLVNVGMLAYFKYAGFLVETLNSLLSVAGLELAAPVPSIILPVGISFYTFQTLSYSIDVYRGSIKGCKSFLDFALFVSFFPQLVAGPIVRASEFLPQLEKPPAPEPGRFSWGITLLVVGLFQKIVLADGLLAPVADQLYAGTAQATVAQSWIGATTFTIQLYFDFAGYSTCAIGVGLCLGFYLPVNFRAPFSARGMSDMWQRWHISFSTWIRDYLYMSILFTGNKASKIKPYVTILITMLLAGLWHGASWRFVFFGLIHSSYLLIEHTFKRSFRKLKKKTLHPYFWVVVAVALTYFGFMIGCVFFRAQSFADAWNLTAGLVGLGGDRPGLDYQGTLVEVAVFITAATLIYQWVTSSIDFKTWATKVPWPLRSLGLAFMLALIFLALPAQSKQIAFIYFQF